MADVKHPLDEQNAIERKIQLEGPRDPDNFKMPDGRTLTEVRRSLNEKHTKEFKEEDQMVRARSRELSNPELSKGEKRIVTEAGNIIDVTEPKKPEERKEEIHHTPPPPPPPPLPTIEE